jgi:hydrogenase/urease accessory protein HupE
VKLGIVFLSVLFILPVARAHEVRPAYLELKETAPGQFSVLWRTPVLSGMRLPIALKLPDDARNLKDPVVQELTDSLVERRWVAAGTNGLAGKRIEFPGLQLTITDVLVRFEMLNGAKGSVIVRPAQPWMEMATTPTRWSTAGAYTRLGIEHILTGIDHLLFVLALIIITGGGWRLVKTVSAFTLSHSLTLTAATLGWVHVPQRPVDAMIALSIVFVAAEIVQGYRGHAGIALRAPWVVAFAFGLLHGLGFANGLSEAGLPQGHIPLALLFFSCGVEIGHLLFVAAVVAILAVGRRICRPLPRWTELVPPYAIGGVAMFWVIQRISVFVQ